jgi:hypothetical protein
LISVEIPPVNVGMYMKKGELALFLKLSSSVQAPQRCLNSFQRQLIPFPF